MTQGYQDGQCSAYQKLKDNYTWPQSLAEFFKVPVNASFTKEQVNIYSEYLAVKSFANEYGTLFHRRFRYSPERQLLNHWIKRQLAKGLITLSNRADRSGGKLYKLVSYEKCWEILNQQKVQTRDNAVRYKFIKIDSPGPGKIKRTKYFKDQILKVISSQYKRQLKYKATHGKARATHLGRPSKIKRSNQSPQVSLSAKAVGLKLGYSSSSTGYKLRKKYFDLIPSPRKLYYPETLVMGKLVKAPRFLCFQVAL